MASPPSPPMASVHNPTTVPHLPIILPSVLPPVSMRLDPSNYAIWKSQVLPTVRAYELQVFLLVTKALPCSTLDDSVNPNFVQWNCLDQFVVSWLLSSTSESMIAHVLHCNMASTIWITLEQLFSIKSKARILHLRFLLQSTKKGSMTVENYFLKTKSLAHELMLVGQPISDDELILYILSGIGTEYESVVVNNLTSKDFFSHRSSVPSPN